MSCFVGVLAAVSAEAAGAELSLSLDRESVAVAEPVTLRVDVGDDVEARWPDWDAVLPGWNVAVIATTPHTAELRLTAYLPGETPVPALEIPVVDAAANPPEHLTLHTTPGTVTVTSVLPEGLDVRDPESLRPTAGDLATAGGHAAPWGWIVGAAALLGATTFWIARRRAGIASDPDSEVDRRLDAGDEPGAAVRHYLAMRRGLDCVAQTPTEFAADSRARKLLGPELHAQLTAFFERAANARYGPDRPGEAVELIDQAKRHVAETRHLAGDVSGKRGAA